MKVALCAIAKAEDNYIEEWIEYYLKLGVDDIFIYQNDWRCKLVPTEHVHFIEFDGSCMQLNAYNDFIQRHYFEYDFGCVFDIDEFLSIKGGIGIKEFLSKYTDIPSISVNWRIYGDSGLKSVDDGNYSLLRRFTKCGKELNHHVKQIINFNIVGNSCGFINPHFLAHKLGYVKSVGCDGSAVVGPFNENVDVEKHAAFLNHYITKTRHEWNSNRVPKGRCDFHRNDKRQSEGRTEKDFDECNINEVEDTTAIDFFLS